MKLLLMLNASLLLCAAVQAKFPADGLIKTAASGAIQGKTVLMKAENAELSKSKLAKIRSVKFIAGMAEKDSGASWEINVAQDGEYILEAWYTFPWTATASARYELKCGDSAPPAKSPRRRSSPSDDPPA